MSAQRAAGNLAGASSNWWDWPTIGTLRRLSAFLRRKPDFLIIGAQRAGTTSLYDYLCRHPQIRAAAVKETHFFTLHFARGPRFYRALFPLRGFAPFLTGEATPYYLFHPLAPARAAQLVPGAKILVLLRNPIDRAFSHFQMSQRAGFETLEFPEALGAEAERLEQEKAVLEAGGHSPAHQNFSYLSRGHYAEQIERWLLFFPKNQLFVAQSEEFYAEPERITGEAMQFLGLDAAKLENLPPLNEARYTPLDEELRVRLSAYFAPHNARLETLLGKRFDWESG